MHEEMIDYIQEHSEVSSRDLALLFLKMKSPDETMAHIAIRAILGKDKRCTYGDDKLWHKNEIVTDKKSGSKIADVNLAAVYLLTHLEAGREKAVHVSVWKVAEPAQLLFDTWLCDPALLPQDEQELLRSVHDTPFSAEGLTVRLTEFVELLKSITPVFLSSRQMSLLFDNVIPQAAVLTERAILVSTLFRCAKITIPRPLSLDMCYKTLWSNAPVLSYAYKQGGELCSCVFELVQQLTFQGITAITELDADENSGINDADFAGKSFTKNDITQAQTVPGVYGFKNKENAYLYIGKAKNLRRRLMNYFRDTEESPDKIDKIRKESYGLVMHACGSELESLIFEYRLIQKHAPVLNTQLSINERKGSFEPIDDCIILLPHADSRAEISANTLATKGMSFWFRKNQKIQIKPFFSDFHDEALLVSELQTFFFNGVLPAASTDFPEQEIATRWVKQRLDDLFIVYVNRVVDAKELCMSMKSLWGDVLDNQMIFVDGE